MIWEKTPSVSRAAIRRSGIVLVSIIAFTVGLGMTGTGHVHDASGQATGVSRS
jgi:hypothetical protein